MGDIFTSLLDVKLDLYSKGKRRFRTYFGGLISILVFVGLFFYILWSFRSFGKVLGAYSKITPVSDLAMVDSFYENGTYIVGLNSMKYLRTVKTEEKTSLDKFCS